MIQTKEDNVYFGIELDQEIPFEMERIEFLSAFLQSSWVRKFLFVIKNMSTVKLRFLTETSPRNKTINAQGIK